MCMESVDTCGALAVSPVSCPTPVVVGTVQMTAEHEQMYSLRIKGERSSVDYVGVMRNLVDSLLLQCWFRWPSELSLYSNIFPFSKARGEGKETSGTQARVERGCWSKGLSKISSGSKAGSSTSQPAVLTPPSLQCLRVPCPYHFLWPI